MCAYLQTISSRPEEVPALLQAVSLLILISANINIDDRVGLFGCIVVWQAQTVRCSDPDVQGFQNQDFL
jgi:hypothetical protein